MAAPPFFSTSLTTPSQPGALPLSSRRTLSDTSSRVIGQLSARAASVWAAVRGVARGCSCSICSSCIAATLCCTSARKGRSKRGLSGSCVASDDQKSNHTLRTPAGVE